MARALTWAPYVYWKRKPFAGKYINVDERGLRRTWNGKLPEEKDSSAIIEVFMFGGSAMWGSGVSDDYTIASIVSRPFSRMGKPGFLKMNRTGPGNSIS